MLLQRSINHASIVLILVTLLLVACAGDSGGSQDPQPEPAVQTSEEESPTVANAEETAPPTEPSQGMETFVINPAESRATYIVDEEFFEDALSKLGIEAGDNEVIGSTQAVEGELQFNPQTLELGENSFMVDLSTLESDQNRRDTWIRENGPRLNVYNEATFTATSISGMPDSYTEGEELQFQVEGDLTIHEVTLPATFDVTARLEDDTIVGVLTTRRLMSDFGIEPPSFVNTLTVADEFGIRVEFTADKQ
jgi:polyisoprenoid-binding protein YceI